MMDKEAMQLQAMLVLQSAQSSQLAQEYHVMHATNALFSAFRALISVLYIDPAAPHYIREKALLFKIAQKTLIIERGIQSMIAARVTLAQRKVIYFSIDALSAELSLRYAEFDLAHRLFDAAQVKLEILHEQMILDASQGLDVRELRQVCDVALSEMKLLEAKRVSLQLEIQSIQSDIARSTDVMSHDIQVHQSNMLRLQDMCQNELEELKFNVQNALEALAQAQEMQDQDELHSMHNITQDNGAL